MVVLLIIVDVVDVRVHIDTDNIRFVAVANMTRA